MSDYNDSDAPYPMADQARLFDGAGTVQQRVFNIVINDALHPSDTVSFTASSDPHSISVHDTINVTETIHAQKILLDNDFVSVSERISFNITRAISIIDNLPILQRLVGFKYKDNQSGNAGDIYIDPAIVAYEGTLTPPGNITFSCNISSALPAAINTSITLRKPSLGDTDSYEAFRVQRNTFGGDLEIYADRIWPVYENLQMSWEYLSKDDADNLLAFLNITEGQLISFANQFGEVLTGYILTPSEKVIQPKVKGYSASLTFQVHNDPNTVDEGDS